MAVRGPQNGQQDLKRGLPLGYGRSHYFPRNKFFDPSTPSMRKVDDGGNGGRDEKKIMTFIVATNVVASRPPECRSPMPIKPQTSQLTLLITFGLWPLCANKNHNVIGRDVVDVVQS